MSASGLPRPPSASQANASRNLLVVPCPGDETMLYGALLSAHAGEAWGALLVFDGRPGTPEAPLEAWQAAAYARGIANTQRVGVPPLPPRDLDPVSASARMRPLLEGYERIFVPDL